MEYKKLYRLLNKLSLSEIFHENTKMLFIEKRVQSEVPDSWKTISFKSYPRFKQIALTPFVKSNFNIEDIINKRRSIRNFKKSQLTIEQLSKILYFSAGITYNGKTSDETLRAYPSAGARYPLEIYPVVFNLKGLEAGVYHYNIKLHCLELLQEGNFNREMFKYIDQEMIKDCSFIIVITAVFNRTKNKYGERGYRHILLEAGHLTQNTYLITTAMGVGCCTIGGFLDNEINKLLNIDGLSESAIYMAAIGTL